MAFEYDLVVIGASRAGIEAAIAATHLKARVALVEQDCSASKQSRSVGWLESPSWAQIEQAMQLESDQGKTFADLAALGVEVLEGCGQFSKQPDLGFEVTERWIRARGYLIATDASPAIPDIEGLPTTDYFTLETIWQHLASLHPDTPQDVIIIGGDPQGIRLAQLLAQWGCYVTLVVSSASVLLQEDPEIARLVQAQLEADGVRILSRTKVTQVKQIQQKKWVQAGHQALEADLLILATGRQPNLAGLNLAAVRVKADQSGLTCNSKLQTTNPRIYGCGAAIAAYSLTNLAIYEAKVAIKNALFFPIFKANYRGIPWTTAFKPGLARVGLTESQAKRRYGKDLMVLREYFKTLPQAQLQEETTGFCKILVRRNGEILGAHILGAEAREMISAIALAMRQNLKISALAELPVLSPAFSEILSKTAADWDRQRSQQTPFLQNLREGYFNWQRSRS
ncbi:MAG: NAD(P)/FAD-dependent oxidoreductase [Leptolyngbyaceae bacterium]|nr:NAD(P)/FAD-dependent oxidoreductase [Leptolyngbyaceae bacterium]